MTDHLNEGNPHPSGGEMEPTPSDIGGDVFRRAIRDAAIGMALVRPDGGFNEVNTALCDFLGYDEPTLRTLSVPDVTHPQDLAADTDLAEQVLAGALESYNLRKRYIHADGHVLTGYLTVSALRDPDGTVKQFIAQIVDVTEDAQTEENLRLFAEHGTDVIARAGNDGTIDWVSPSVTRATGWRPEQLVDVPFIGLVHPDDRPLMATGDSGTGAAGVNVRLMHADSTFSWFAIIGDPVRGGNGELLGHIATWRGIDAQIQAQRMAAQREAEFRMLAENGSDVVIKIGQDGRISWVSPSAVATLGWNIQKVVGSLPGEYLHPDDAKEAVREVRNLTMAKPTTQRPRRVLRDDGSYCWFSVKASLVVDDEGQPAGRVLGLRDIDDEVRAQHALEASERIFRTAMESAPGGMAVLGLDRAFLQVNKALCAMLGRQAAWLTDHRIDDVLHSDDLSADRTLRSQVQSGMQHSGVKECRLLRADGTVVWVEHAIGLVRDENGSPVSYVSQFVDISEARESRRELEFLAGHDPLTRLSNRRNLVERMGTAMQELPRTGTRVGVVFVDLDRLKAVNDAYGHAAGDELIVNVAQRIRNAVRADDIVARLGGDEFVVVLIRVHDLEDALDVADRIRESVAAPIAAAGHTLQVTASAGATLAAPGEAPDDAIARADRLLYQAKAAGGDHALGG